MPSSTALIIIDMQVGMSWSSLPKRNNSEAEARILDLLTHWRSTQAPIVHVRHISRTPSSAFWPGQVGVEFQPTLKPLSSEHVVEKNVPDAFINGGLERWLHQRSIRDVIIVGVSTNNSVEATARTSGNLGFETYVASDATFTFAMTDFMGIARTAEDIHAMSLANLHGEYANIKTAAELISLFPNTQAGKNQE
jgi:nicotinamidase-related amidase